MRTTPKFVMFGVALCTAFALAAAMPQSDKSTPPAKPAAPAKAAPASDSAAAAYERMKSLAGSWKSSMEGEDHTSTITYRVIANGSAVVESMLAGTPMEMETIYHLDGDRLLATHYCAAGNQPRMKATKITPTSTTFEFLDATNLPSRNAMHMGGLVLEFVDKDHVKANWTSFKDGKAEEHAIFSLTREAAKPAATAGTAANSGTSGTSGATGTGR